jgi:hypothetical protein
MTTPHGHTNTTTPFIDQNQTYTSHPSHQVFLREYEMVDGKPVATGNLLDNAKDWAKAPGATSRRRPPTCWASS